MNERRMYSIIIDTFPIRSRKRRGMYLIIDPLNKDLNKYITSMSYLIWDAWYENTRSSLLDLLNPNLFDRLSANRMDIRNILNNDISTDPAGPSAEGTTRLPAELIELICDFSHGTLKYFHLLRSEGELTWRTNQKIIEILEFYVLSEFFHISNEFDWKTRGVILDGLKLSVKLKRILKSSLID